MSANRQTQSDTQPDNLTVKAKPLALLVHPAALRQTEDSEVSGDGSLRPMEAKEHISAVYALSHQNLGQTNRT